jgi:hypothetical protein
MKAAEAEVCCVLCCRLAVQVPPGSSVFATPYLLPEYITKCWVNAITTVFQS